MTSFSKKPLAYVCFLCGQQYGSQSLHIHIPQCAVKWCQQHNKTTAPTAPPELPASADQLPKGAAAINAFNATMLSVWQSSSLERCPYCNRTFRLDALEHHSKVCTPAHPFKPLPGGSRTSSNQTTSAGRPTLTAAAAAARYSTDRLAGPAAKSSSQAGRLVPPNDHHSQKSNCGVGCSSNNSSSSGMFGDSGKMPKAFTCFLCGQQYGSKSLLIHYVQCQDKWAQQQQLLPSQQRLPVPDVPAGLMDYMSGVVPLPTAAQDIAEFNDVAFSKYNSSSLVPCSNCGRTFRPEALEHHARFCTADRPMKRK